MQSTMLSSKKIVGAGLLSAVLLLCGCDKTTSTLGGAAVGTGLGAGTGYAIGGSGGAILGGVLGGLAGGAVGHEMGEDESNNANYARPATDSNERQRLEVQRQQNEIELKRLEIEKMKLQTQ